MIFPGNEINVLKRLKEYSLTGEVIVYINLQNLSPFQVLPETS